MSRLRRLKNNKRKKIIKTTICSLALSITIGSTKNISTYAWFIDKEEINNNILISTGELDVLVSDGFNGEKLNDVEPITNEFTISNEGTLKEKLQVGFSLSKENSLPSQCFEWIDYELTINDENGEQIIIDGSDILNSNNKFDLIYEDGNPLILDKGEQLNCKSSLVINKETPSDILAIMSGKSLEFDISVLASQLSYDGNGNLKLEHKGFKDVDNQKNLAYISNIESNETNLKVHFQEKKEEIKIFIPNDYKPNEIVDISVGKGTGEFENIEIDAKKKYHFVIEKSDDKKFSKNKIGNKFSDNNKLEITITFSDRKGNQTITTTETWIIKFRINKKGKLEAYYEITDCKQQIKEDAEVPENPGVEGPADSTNPGIRPTPPIEKPEGPGVPEIEGPEGSTNPGIRPNPPIAHPGESEIDPIPPIEQEIPEIIEPVQPEIQEEPKEEVEA